MKKPKKFPDTFTSSLISEVLSKTTNSEILSNFFSSHGYDFKSGSVKAYLSHIRGLYKKGKLILPDLSPDQLNMFLYWINKTKKIDHKTKIDDNHIVITLPWSVPSKDGITRFENLDFRFKLCRTPLWDDRKRYKLEEKMFCGNPVTHPIYSLCDKCKERFILKKRESDEKQL